MIKKAIVMAGITALSLINTPKINASQVDVTKNLIENFHDTVKDHANNIELSHKEIINIKLTDLFEKYWKEKWLEMFRKHTLIEINIIRNNVKWLKENAVLNKTAQEYVEYMVQNDHIGHYDLDGTSPDDRVKKNWYTKLVKENIHMSSWTTIKSFLTSQMNSKWHKENILTWKNNVWIGLFTSSKNLNYIVLLFDK